MEDHRKSHNYINNNPDQAFLEELQEKLSKELDMPHSQRNYDQIEEWTETISLLLGTNELIDKRTEIGITQLRQKRERIKQKHTKQILRVIVPCFCVVLLVLSNVFSQSVLGMNAFLAMYQIMKGGITIDFKKQGELTTASTSDYQSEMLRICEEQSINPRIPSYLPDGYTPTEIFGQVHPASSHCTVIFCFERNKSKILLQIVKYENSDEMPPMGIPTDHYNISEQVIDNTVICISKEDQQFTAVFEDDTIQYMLFSEGLDYDECQRILNSMF